MSDHPPPPLLSGPLALVTEETPRSAALNMALDEALLPGLAIRERVAVLRVYRWDRPAVSFGYFERWAAVRARFGASAACVRRWTGGGVVEHGDGVDWTYALLLPRGDGGGGTEPAAGWSAAELYRLIHSALAEALREELGWSVELAGLEPADPGRAPDGLNACFTRPVRSDVLQTGTGRKVAGAAQRHTRGGLLHQGSVRVVGMTTTGGGQGAAPAAGWWRSLADRFARELVGDHARLVTPRAIPPDALARAEELVETRYGEASWTEKR